LKVFYWSGRHRQNGFASARFDVTVGPDCPLPFFQEASAKLTEAESFHFFRFASTFVGHGSVASLTLAQVASLFQSNTDSPSSAVSASGPPRRRPALARERRT
jgi:hypothetical protein